MLNELKERYKNYTAFAYWDKFATTKAELIAVINLYNINDYAIIKYKNNIHLVKVYYNYNKKYCYSMLYNTRLYYNQLKFYL